MPELDQNINYVTVRVSKMKIGNDGHFFEEIEEKQVPDFVARILLSGGLVDNEAENQKG